MKDDLYVKHPDGSFTFQRSVNEDDVIQLAKRFLVRQFKNRPLFPSPIEVKDYLCHEIGRSEHEIFACLFLDNSHRLISFERMFNETINGSTVHPREVLKRALSHNAAAVILAHNHPSGTLDASEADRRITERLKEVLGLVDIQVLDHIIVSHDASMSFAEQGLL